MDALLVIKNGRFMATSCLACPAFEHPEDAGAAGIAL